MMFSMKGVRGLIPKLTLIENKMSDLLNYVLFRNIKSKYHIKLPVTEYDLTNEDGDYVDKDGNVVDEEDKIIYTGIEIKVEIDGVETYLDYNDIFGPCGIECLPEGDDEILNVRYEKHYGNVKVPNGVLLVLSDITDTTSLSGEEVHVVLHITKFKYNLFNDNGYTFIDPEANNIYDVIEKSTVGGGFG